MDSNQSNINGHSESSDTLGMLGMKESEVFRMTPGFFGKSHRRVELPSTEMEKAMGGLV